MRAEAEPITHKLIRTSQNDTNRYNQKNNIIKCQGQYLLLKLPIPDWQVTVYMVH